ncbi:MAG: adenylosuccinate synthetase, partial [Bacteroidales bacterium]|nr:adenylosuccinate synthetase [Bacteroidales bacterium]
ELNDYIEFIENYVGVPITLVSYGPDRSECIERPVK